MWLDQVNSIQVNFIYIIQTYKSQIMKKQSDNTQSSYFAFLNAILKFPFVFSFDFILNWMEMNEPEILDPYDLKKYIFSYGACM